MTNKVCELPTILTSFSYGEHYFVEMDGFFANARELHPSWRFVIGKGPAPGYDLPTFEVESPEGKSYWSLPMPLDLDRVKGSAWDFDRICLMVGWWVARVWSSFGGLAGGGCHRVLYSDVDNRFNAPLDIELDPTAEVVASPWWHEPEYFDGKGMLCTGLSLFQGKKDGIVEGIINEWSRRCLDKLGYASQPGPSADFSDEEFLTEVLHERTAANADYALLKLDRYKYSCWPIEGLTFNETTISIEDRKIIRRGLVDQWHFSSKMKLPEGSNVRWPPPEEFRRRAPIGSFLKW